MLIQFEWSDLQSLRKIASNNINLKEWKELLLIISSLKSLQTQISLGDSNEVLKKHR